jgi:hypothetical protein
MLVWAVLILFSISFFGCATIFYSERIGNSSGKLDIGMCILGFFFFWPISWIVDLCTGAIWMDGSRRLPDSGGANFTDANQFTGDRILMPAEGEFSFRLPVRGDGAHVIDLRLVTEDNLIACAETIRFTAGPDWEEVRSILKISAGNSENGTLTIAIDGKRRAEIPVAFAVDAD